MANVLIGVTGSIAGYKIIELAHILKKNGHDVKIILTKEAQKFVTKLSFAAFGVEVFSDENNLDDHKSIMQHIDLARWPDIIIIAPLSANTLSKISMGFADNLLTSTILATTKPVYLVPAMNMFMWQNPIIQNHTKNLRSYGYAFWGPDNGVQACGDIGNGRMIEPQEIYANIQHHLLIKTKIFQNKKVVITAGSTLEEIDPVRYISNHSSGKMGYAIARAFASLGADVTLISGNSNLSSPTSITNTIKVQSADDMLIASLTACDAADIFIGCAAVCDYKALKIEAQKIKKTNNEHLTIECTKNPDIIATIKNKYPELFVVGFAAETTNLIEYAKAKVKTKNLDLIIANDVSNSRVFGSDENKVIVIDKDLSIVKEIMGDKNIIAHDIAEIIFDYL